MPVGSPCWRFLITHCSDCNHIFVFSPLLTFIFQLPPFICHGQKQPPSQRQFNFRTGAHFISAAIQQDSPACAPFPGHTLRLQLPQAPVPCCGLVFQLFLAVHLPEYLPVFKFLFQAQPFTHPRWTTRHSRVNIREQRQQV